MSNILSEISLHDTIYKLKDDNAVTQEQLEEALGNIDMSEVETHIADKNNPHEVTAEQTGAAPAVHNHTKSEITDFPTSMPASDVSAWAKTATKPTYTAEEVGLGNVPNVTTNDQTPTYSEASTLVALTSGEKLSVALGKIKKAIADLIAHIINKSNPHDVTAEQIGAATTTQLNSLSKIYIQLDAPTNPKDGDLWVDTDDEGGEVLAAVATSGNYNDLINRPTIITSYNSLTDKPTIITMEQVKAEINTAIAAIAIYNGSVS